MNPTTTRSTAATIILCFFVALIEGFDIQALGIAAPKMGPDIGLSRDALGWLAALSSAGMVLGAILGGRLGDRYGRRPVLLIAVLTFGVFTFGMAVVPTVPLMFITRMLAGIGFGAALPAMMAVSNEISGAKNKGITAAAMFCGMPAGGGSAALLTQFLPGDYDWRLLFIIGGLLPLLVAPALYFLMPETLRTGHEVKVAQHNTAHALFGGGRAWPTLLLWAAFLPTLLMLYLILNWLPTLVHGKGLSAAIAPQASIAFNYGAVIGALLIARISDRLGARWPLTLTYMCLVVALFALGNANTQLAMVSLSGLVGFFLLGGNYALYGVAPAHYPLTMRATGSGGSVAVGRVGAVFGPYLPSLLFSQGMSESGVIATMVPFAIVAAISVFCLSFFRRPEAG